MLWNRASKAHPGAAINTRGMPAAVSEVCGSCDGTRWIGEQRCSKCCLHGSGVWPEEDGTYTCNAGCGAEWDSHGAYYDRCWELA